MSSPKSIWDEFKNEDFAHAYFDEHLNIFIATQLKVLREQREFTQAELAKVAHMAQERISVIENVNYSSWTISTLRRLARALGVRLRVSFESFGSGLQEENSFTKESLKRPSLQDELKARFSQWPLAENAAIQAAYADAARINEQQNTTPLITIRTPKEFLDRPKVEDETNLNRTSARAMAFSHHGSKSERQGRGEKFLN